jgi:D-alanyl-D-alanine dipeptidase
MGHNHADRLSKARKEIRAAGLDAVVVTPSPDLAYLVGYDAPVLERLTALVLRPGGDPVLLVPELERPRAADSPAGKLVEIRTWPDGEDPYAVARGLLPEGGTLGATDRMWAAQLISLQQALPTATFVPASVALGKLRARKDAGEIHLLGRAARCTDEAFRRITREGLESRTEEDVAKALRHHMVDSGHDSADFWIVASGPNGASPHHEPGGRSIRMGDAVVLDFGGWVGGYCSDMTRTVCVGDPSAEIKEVHEIVREAQEAAFRSAGPGVPAEEVDRAARRVIDEAGYGACFIHRTGHGIGLEVHEPPYIVQGNVDPLEPGMCFSIEPGIYLPGQFGVRIEDIVAVTDDAAVRLNHAPRELVVLG